MINSESDGPLTRRLALGSVFFRARIFGFALALPAGDSEMDFAPNSTPQIRLDRKCYQTEPMLYKATVGGAGTRLPALNMMMRGFGEFALEREPGSGSIHFPLMASLHPHID